MMEQSDIDDFDTAWNIAKDELCEKYGGDISGPGTLEVVPSITEAKYFDLWSVLVQTKKGFKYGHDIYSVLGQLSNFIEIRPDHQETLEEKFIRERKWCYKKWDHIETDNIDTEHYNPVRKGEFTWEPKWHSRGGRFKWIKVKLDPFNSCRIIQKGDCMRSIQYLNNTSLRKLKKSIYIIDLVLLAHVHMTVMTKDNITRKFASNQIYSSHDYPSGIPVAFRLKKYEPQKNDGPFWSPWPQERPQLKPYNTFEVDEEFKKKGVEILPEYKVDEDKSYMQTNKPSATEIDQGKKILTMEEPKEFEEESQKGCCGCTIL